MRKEKKPKKAKKVILWIVAILLMIVAIILAAYPFISDYVNSINVQGQGVVYEENVEKLDEIDYDQLLRDARSYNAGLIGSTYNDDPFAKVFRYPDDYMDMLRIDNTDVMASISIPKINVNLPIYHGTSDEILQEGVGHLSTSSLPVGGKGSHCILTGHTGYSQLRLFSDVDQMEEGDVFFITVLKEKLAYRVYAKDVILPEETGSLQIDPDEDYCTLVTCYPFGVNTHRLLIRGTRIDLGEGEELAKDQTNGESTWDQEYKKAILLGLALLAAILIVFFTLRYIVRKIKRSKQKKTEQAALLPDQEDKPDDQVVSEDEISE
ncbi:MAG: class C sortase [Ruminococcus sp.]|nr:class C sortase [Ruminococcus sp.]